MTITQKRLKELLHYDLLTGVFTWVVDHGNRKAGDIAGYPDKKGYTIIGIDWGAYKAHRLAVLYVTGEFPRDQVDHKNLLKSSNEWTNLREATNGQNQRNSHKYKNNTSGFKGVSWHKRAMVFVAKIKINGKQIHLGCFDDPKMANAAYEKAAIEHHKEFARIL